MPSFLQCQRTRLQMRASFLRASVFLRAAASSAWASSSSSLSSSSSRSKPRSSSSTTSSATSSFCSLTRSLGLETGSLQEVVPEKCVVNEASSTFLPVPSALHQMPSQIISPLAPYLELEPLMQTCKARRHAQRGLRVELEEMLPSSFEYPILGPLIVSTLVLAPRGRGPRSRSISWTAAFLVVFLLVFFFLSAALRALAAASARVCFLSRKTLTSRSTTSSHSSLVHER